MDLRTMLIAIIITTLTYAGMLGLIAYLRKEPVLRFYALAFFVGSFAYFIAFISDVDSWISILLFNQLFLTFIALVTSGLRRFFGVNPWPSRIWLYLFMNLAVFIYGIYIQPSYVLRVLSITFFAYLLLGDLFLAVWPKIAKLGEGWRLTFEILFGVHLILVTLRLTAVFDPSPVNFWMENESGASISLLLSLVTFSLWAIGIVVLDTFQVILKLNAKNSVLTDLAMKDALTGIPNRMMMDIELNQFMALAKRYNTSISFIIADIDFFKKVNDDYGHDIGDSVLIKTASIIKDVIRLTDRVYRWGGEEFLIVAPHTDLEGARILAEKIRLKYQEATFKSVGKLTISFGVAEYYPEESRELWFKRADIALYHAKSGGRNRVEIWKPTRVLDEEFTKILWQERWNSGNPTIDESHQELIDMTNTFFDMVSKATHPHAIREHFTKIITHLQRHFLEEEKELEAVDYDCIQQHQAIHRRLLSELSTMQENIDNEKLDYRTYFVFLVGKVVIGHLLTEDTKFFPLFQEGTAS